MTLSLKPKEQASILAGQYPELVRPEKDFEEGEEIVLKTTTTINGPIPEVSICILGHAKRKNGAWEAIYRVKDDRGVYAAQGLGYTRSPTRALDNTAPILDPAVIESYAAEATQATVLLQAEHWREDHKEDRESSVPTSSRSQRTKERHVRSLASERAV